MRWVRAVLAGIWGLFVDDGVFALSVIAWLVAVGLLATSGLPSLLLCVGLFAGLAALLLHSTRRRARRR